MAWHQHQQRTGMNAAHESMGFQNDFLLARVRAPGHPHWPGRSVQLPQLPSPFADIRRPAEVEFDVARHMSAIGIGPQGLEAIGISFALSSHDYAARQS